tara:strand:+ start:1199 stop:1510 length:312 start_codon:yes stop_codon:yes gene_type:complete
MIKNIGTTEAIIAINPDAQVTVSTPESGVETIDWGSTTVISQVDIDAKLVELEADWTTQAYARTRKAKYDLLNQDEMRYDDLVNSTTTWRDGIAAIKVAHPKP